MLHDIGKLVLNSLACRPGNVIRPLHEILTLLHCADLLAAEEACFGTNHAALGQQIAELWSLPEDLADAIGEHHRGDISGTASLSMCVALANMVASNYDPDYPPLLRPPLPPSPPIPLECLISIVAAQRRPADRSEPAARLAQGTVNPPGNLIGLLARCRF